MVSKCSRSNHYFKPTMLGIPEEVGMDIVEAIEVLNIKCHKKSEKTDDEKKKVWDKLNQQQNKKAKVKVKMLPFPLPHPKVLKKVQKEFLSELQNEWNYQPLPSSSTLSAWFRSNTPQRSSKNILFKENVTTGLCVKCQIRLTPQVLSIMKNGAWPMSSIHERIHTF